MLSLTSLRFFTVVYLELPDISPSLNETHPKLTQYPILERVILGALVDLSDPLPETLGPPRVHVYRRVDLRVCVLLATETRGQYGVPFDSFQEVPSPNPAQNLVLNVTVCGALLRVLARIFYNTFPLQFVGVLLSVVIIFRRNWRRWFLQELRFEGFIIEDWIEKRQGMQGFILVAAHAEVATCWEVTGESFKFRESLLFNQPVLSEHIVPLFGLIHIGVLRGPCDINNIIFNIESLTLVWMSLDVGVAVVLLCRWGGSQACGAPNICFVCQVPKVHDVLKGKHKRDLLSVSWKKPAGWHEIVTTQNLQNASYRHEAGRTIWISCWSQLEVSSCSSSRIF